MCFSFLFFMYAKSCVFLSEQEACDWGRICSVLLANLVKPPPMNHVRREVKRQCQGPLPHHHRGGRVSDDIIMTGFGWFASLLMSSTGASNWTFTTQLGDRRERDVFSVASKVDRNVSNKLYSNAMQGEQFSQIIFIPVITKEQGQDQREACRTHEWAGRER